MKLTSIISKLEDVKSDLLVLTIYKGQKDLPLSIKKIDAKDIVEIFKLAR